MNSSQKPTDGASPTAAEPDAEPFRLRSYQAEMVEESMRSNIICVMDTGSGKTHIAIERTRAELETCQPDKIVWFLAPTVTLCEQQYDIFKSNLPGFGIQLLSGSDNIDHWTEQSVWDAVLHNVRIVLSTHKVLVDALTHAFVRMSGIALLIFDEAHHCTRKHPAHKIMSEFYVPLVESGSIELPVILGLSASPVMNAKATQADLQQIESNLSATARTPKLHRSELLRYVHRPELIRVNYPLEPTNETRSALLNGLKSAFASYDFNQDPYVVELLNQQRKGIDTSRQFQKTMMSGKTYCSDQLKSLAAKGETTSQELGWSAMEWYLRQCIARFEEMVRVSESQIFDWTNEEKQHLLKILTRLPLINLEICHSVLPDRLSQKVEKLVEVLAKEAQQNPMFTGIVFVEQRVWVATLAEILAVHPQTRDLFRVGTFVGTSKSTKRKTNIAAFAEPRNQQATLEDFKAGKINLILATSVLEEGIDVSSCNVVICFERPKNLKSFVQRRGRARQQMSKYFIFTPDVNGGRPPESWQSLENEMRAAYENDSRQVQLAEERQMEDEDGERFYKVPSTGALLTLDNASQHLYHFCAVLDSGPFVDTRPQFEFTEISQGRVLAKVVLPISVDPSVRTTSALETWKTERMAKKDAAFEAYKGLYLAGLVNNNLLPARQGVDDEAADFQIPDRPSMAEISPYLDPWLAVAHYQSENPNVYYRTLLKAQAAGEEPIRMLLFTPTPIPNIPTIPMFWNKSKQYTIYSSMISRVDLSDSMVRSLRFVTHKALHSVSPSRVQADKDDFVWLLAPCGSDGQILDISQILKWHIPNDGLRPATELISEGLHDPQSWGLVSLRGDFRKFMVKAIRIGTSSEGEPKLQMTRLPKRRDFLHPMLNVANDNDAHTRVEEFPAAECLVEAFPTPYIIFALFVPSVLYVLTTYMNTDTLRTTLLQSVAFEATHLPLLVRALTSSAADDNNNYQRLEFFGDCILKFIASVHLMADNLNHPEGFLTGKKGRIVSNGYLARASLAAGLDKFIIVKKFTGAKWTPKYTGDLMAQTAPPEKIEKSTKLIADVIESLIGASYIVGGFAKAFSCVQALLPLEAWTPMPMANDILYDAAPSNDALCSNSILEKLIGYTFEKKSLLFEALTHGSYTGANAQCSYNRLEFLGDAVLDYIVSRRLYPHSPELPHQTMHGIRSAMVNASFLTFRMFETSILEETTNTTTLQPEQQHRALWQFLRAGHELIGPRDSARKQHELARQQVAAALEHDAQFPWHLLSLTDPPKFLSDIVESVIGAVYVDSHGDISACEAIVRRLGIIDCLDRILRDGVDCFHPKERLGVLIVEKKAKYVRVTDDNEGEVEDAGLYKCQVQVNGKNIGGVVGGLSKLTAETIAAWHANSILGRSDDGDVGGEEASDEAGDAFFEAEEGGGTMLDD